MVESIIGKIIRTMVTELIVGLTRIGDGESDEFTEHVGDHLDGVGTLLVADRISNKKLAARQGRGFANVRGIVLQVRQSAGPHEFVQNMTWKTNQFE